MSHDHIKSLDGLKGHAQLFTPQHLLQQLQVHLGYMLDTNLLEQEGLGGGEKEDSEGEETKREERGIGGIRGGKKGERGERGGGERYGGKGRERERKREGEGKRGRGRERGREGGGGGKEAREGGRGRKRRGGTGKMKGRCKDKND